MPSRRYRSRRSFGSQVNKVRSSVARTDNVSIPLNVGDSAVTSNTLAKNAVITDAIIRGAVDSASLGIHSYQPSGEKVQRVPASLKDLYYWSQVVEDRVELHNSGVHGEAEFEDIQHVAATKNGLVLSPTETEKARIYLTGRLPIPKSEKIYAQWSSNTEVSPRLIYWVNTPEYLIESAKRVDGITYFNIDSNTSEILTGSTIRVTETIPGFDTLYKVIAVDGDIIQATDYEQAASYFIADSSYNATSQVITFVVNQPELLANPSIDVDDSAWSVSGGNIAYTNSQSYAGAGSLEITEDISQSNNLPVVFSNATVNPLRTYKGSFYVKGPVGTSVSARFIEFDDADVLVRDAVSPAVAMNNSWVSVNILQDMSATTHKAILNAVLNRTQIFPESTTLTFDSSLSGWSTRNMASAQVNTSVFRGGTGSAFILGASFVGADSIVTALGTQSDGKAVIFGDFDSFRGNTAGGIVRLNEDGSEDTSFTVGTGAGFVGNVESSAAQADGKYVVVGDFSSVGSTVATRVARLNSDGSVDTSFVTNTGSGLNNTGSSVALQANGMSVIAGNFTTFNGTTVNRIVRLATNGTRDTAFTTNAGTGFNNTVVSVGVQSNDRIVAVGQFTTFKGNTVNGVARLFLGGGHDTAFTANTGTGFALSGTLDYIDRPSQVAIQPDQKIVIVGNFTTFNGNTVNGIVRINSDGSQDTAFTANTGTGFISTGYPAGGVRCVAVQSDGKILAGGAFTEFNGTDAFNLVRLNSDGTLDTAFSAAVGQASEGLGSDQEINVISVLPDGKILLGGNFTEFDRKIFNRFVCLNPDGSINERYNTYNVIGPGSGNVTDLAEQPDGKIVVTGSVFSYQDSNANKLYRINTDGTIDSAFSANISNNFNRYEGFPQTVAVNSTAVVVGGNFTTYAGNTVNRLIRFDSNGNEDTTFTSGIGTGINNNVFSVVLQSDGKAVAGGEFTTFNGNTVNRIVRTNTNGALDTAFRTNTGTGFGGTASFGGSPFVYDIALQSDGKLVVGGDFSLFNGTTINSIARLNADGTRDTGFTPGTGLTSAFKRVEKIAIQSDGKILLAGWFTTYNGTTVNNFARLNSNGTLDTAFNTNLGAGFSSFTYHVAVQSDGKIIVAGLFSSVKGVDVPGVARLNSDGNPDTTFNSQISSALGTRNPLINSLFIDSNGKIVLSGFFGAGQYGGVPVRKLVRLNSDGTIDSTFNKETYLSEFYGYFPEIESDVTYGFSSYLRSTSSNTNAVVAIHEYSDANATVEVSNTKSAVTPISNTDWSPLFVNHTFSANAQVATFSVFTALGAGGQGIHVDDAQLRVSPYGSTVYLDEASVKDVTHFDSLSDVDIRPEDLVILEEVTGAEEFAGVYGIVSSDSTTNTSQVVFTVSNDTAESNEDFYNNSIAYIVRGGSTDTINEQNFSPFGKLSEDDYRYIDLEDKQIWGARGYIQTISSAGITSGLATISSISPHYAQVGDEVEVYGLDASLGFSTGFGGFDGRREVLSVVDERTITFVTDSSDTVTKNIIDGIPYYVKISKDIPKEYAVYIEAEANTPPVVYSDFSVFEIVGEPSSAVAGAEVNSFALVNSNVILTLNSMPSIVTPNVLSGGFLKTYTVSIDPNTLNQPNTNIVEYIGQFTALSANLTDNTITYSVPYPSFIQNIGTGFDGEVRAIQVQSDKQIVVGGNFTSFSGNSAGSLTVLNSDGTQNVDFRTVADPGFDGAVRDIAIQADGKYLVAGEFTSYEDIGGPSTSEYFARIASNGAMDLQFFGAFDFPVSTVALQSDGKILAGGEFTLFSGNTTNYIVRINSDGSEDSDFTANTGTGFDYFVNDIAVHSDNTIVVGGFFNDFNGNTVNSIVRLNPDGSEDTGFTANTGIGFNGEVKSVAIQSDGEIVVGGQFSAFNGNSSNGAAKLHANGALNTTFTTNIGTGFDLGSIIDSVRVVSDGDILVSGTFYGFNGATVNNVIRLHANGTPNTSFDAKINTFFNTEVFTAIEEPGGKVLLGGDFQEVGTWFSNNIARLHPSGRMDAGLDSESVAGAVDIEVGIKHSEINPGGFSLYNESGSVISRLNALEFNTFSVGPASISADGNASFGSTSVGGSLDVEGASTFDDAATFNQDLKISSATTNSTSNLYGDYDQAKYHVVSDVIGNIIATTSNISPYSGDILNRFARGLIYSVRLAEANVANHLLSTLHGAFGAGSFKLEKDRNYLFVMSTGSTRVNTATNVDVHLEFVLSNSAPTFNVNAQATPNVVKKVQVRGGTTGTYSDMVLQYTSVDTSVSPINDGVANVASDFRIAADTDIYWMLRWATNTTTRTALNFSRVTTDKNAFFNIYDMGPSSPALVGNMDSDSTHWLTAGTAVSSTTGNTTSTRTATFNATASRAREGTSTYVDNDPIYQSNATNPANPRKSQIRFPAWTSIPTLQEDISKPGFTITKMEVKLNITNYNFLGTLFLGVSGSTNAANTVIPAPIIGSPVVTNPAALGERYYDITVLSSYFQNGTARSLLVGLTDSASNTYTNTASNYFVISGIGSSSNIQMRVTYSYTVA